MPTDKTIDFVVAFLVIGCLTLGLASMLLGWIVRQWDRLMSRRSGGAGAQSGDESGANRALSQAETNRETADNLRWVAEREDELFHSGENLAIARLIAAGVVKLTEGVKEGTGKRSGDAYSKRSKEIQALVKELRDKYPQRTPEQEAARESLRLN
jgi:hypothetical protein